MRSWKEAIESIQTFCWNATEEDDLDDKVKEYLKAYPHLRNPATIDILRETIITWQNIQKLEKMGYTPHVAFKLKELLEFYLQTAKITRDQYERTITYLRNS